MTNNEKQKEALMNYRMLRKLYDEKVNDEIITGMAINAVNIVVAEYPDDDEIKTTDIKDVRSIIEKNYDSTDYYGTYGNGNPIIRFINRIKQNENLSFEKIFQIISEALGKEIITIQSGRFYLK